MIYVTYANAKMSSMRLYDLWITKLTDFDIIKPEKRHRTVMGNNNIKDLLILSMDIRILESSEHDFECWLIFLLTLSYGHDNIMHNFRLSYTFYILFSRQVFNNISRLRRLWNNFTVKMRLLKYTTELFHSQQQHFSFVL